jgi:hypothetical protein
VLRNYRSSMSGSHATVMSWCCAIVIAKRHAILTSEFRDIEMSWFHNGSMPQLRHAAMS